MYFKSLTVAYFSWQAEAAEEVEKKQKRDLEVLKNVDLSRYAIKGSEQEWDKALSQGPKAQISVKRWHIAASSVKKKSLHFDTFCVILVVLDMCLILPTSQYSFNKNFFACLHEKKYRLNFCKKT